MKQMNYAKHLTINNVKIQDSFWNKINKLVKDNVIPYQYLALSDKIDTAEKSYSIENFIKAAAAAKDINGGKTRKTYPVDKWCYNDDNCENEAFHGWVFQDTDVYKWLEAVGFSLQNQPDAELEKNAKKIIEIVCNAQLDDGYLDTLYIINDISKRFTNLRDFHELYCFGHLAEAGISFYHGSGDRRLLEAACRFADLICNTFGTDKLNGYGGHEIAEMALIKLYEETDKKEYLETAYYFINERGKKPYYYDKEHNTESTGYNYFYNQAHIEPRYQNEAVGHAVRGVYLYSAMADAAKYYNDAELFTACKAIWNNIVHKKMYITGGIGATVNGEAFSFNYDLPNDLAYCETCASIGLIFFARRMAEIEAHSQYGDIMERALYNTVLSGMSEDGKAFFYVNPLEVLPEASKNDSRKSHIKTARQKWFSCACCPPNLARLISSLNEYIFTENDDTIFVNMYIGSSLKSSKAAIDIYSQYLENGKLCFAIEHKKDFKLALRIPEWCKNFDISAEYEMKNGFAVIKITESKKINLTFEIKPRIVKCSNMVRANTDKVAVERGPIVYCLEEKDNSNNLHLLKISDKTKFITQGEFLIADGYKEAEETTLYSEYSAPKLTACKLKFIPYYRWGNRGENEMRVYVRIENEQKR